MISEIEKEKKNVEMGKRESRMWCCGKDVYTFKSEDKLY